MKKHARIGLMFLVMLILCLAWTNPGLADEPTFGPCVTQYPADATPSKSDHYIWIPIILPGEFTEKAWYDGTLVNVCEGEVPFGEVALGNGKVTIYTYAELATLDDYVVEDDYTYMSADTATFFHPGLFWTIPVFEIDASWSGGTWYPATDWWVRIYPEGRFVLYTEYAP